MSTSTTTDTTTNPNADTTASEEQIRAVEVIHAPARFSSAIAVTAGLLAVLASAPASILGFLVGVFGLGGLAAGQFVLHSKRLAGLGTAVIFAGVIVGALLGNDAVLVTFGALATILAFDTSQNAFSVGDQLSQATDTQRGELVHAAASFFVGAIVTVVAFTIYAVAGGEVTVGALAFVLLAAIVLAWAVRA